MPILVLVLIFAHQMFANFSASLNFCARCMTAAAVAAVVAATAAAADVAPNHTT